MAATKQDESTKVHKAAALGDKAKSFIIKNFLPLAFLVALGLALAWPVPGRFLADLAILGNVRIVQVAAMALVFLITGLQLNTAELRRALQPRNALLLAYGFVAILVITPCLGFALRAAPLEPKAFATGLAIFCVAPTTLGVGVALTTACGGNEAMALLLTVGTNALAVATMPPELRLLLSSASGGGGSGGGNGGGDGKGAGFNLDVKVTDLLIKLAITVLVPFAIGKAARELSAPTLAFVKAHRLALSLTSTSCLAFVVWQTLSAARDTLLAQRPGPVFAMMGLAVAMHLAYLAGNYVLVWWVMRAPLKEAIAVVIMSSQKSAPVAVTCITFLTRDSAQQGLLSLPAIVGQLCQIFIGAGLAKWLARVVARDEAAKKAAAEAGANADSGAKTGAEVAAADAAAAAAVAAEASAAEEGRAGAGVSSAVSPQVPSEPPAAAVVKPIGCGGALPPVDPAPALQPGMGAGAGGGTPPSGDSGRWRGSPGGESRGRLNSPAGGQGGAAACSVQAVQVAVAPSLAGGGPPPQAGTARVGAQRGGEQPG